MHIEYAALAVSILALLASASVFFHEVKRSLKARRPAKFERDRAAEEAAGDGWARQRKTSDLSIELDADELIALLDELSALAPKVIEQTPELRERLVDVLHRLPQLVVVETDRLSAAGADDLLVRAKPAEALRELVAAARTGELNIEIIERIAAHGALPDDVRGQSSTGARP